MAMMLYAAASACIGATPAAYAADVMPQSVSGFGLGIYRCAGDIGGSALTLLASTCFCKMIPKEAILAMEGALIRTAL